MAGVAVENGIEVTRLDPGPDGVRVELSGSAGGEILYVRKVVLAGGRDGAGAPYRPAFPSLPRESKAGGDRVFHSSDRIDFARFKGGRIGVLGASASAFDNAAVALESGAAEAHLFVRRPHLPQINKNRSGLHFRGYSTAIMISTMQRAGACTATSSHRLCRRRTSRCCAATGTQALPYISRMPGST